jgi:hypothetical protein
MAQSLAIWVCADRRVCSSTPRGESQRVAHWKTSFWRAKSDAAVIGE